MSECCYQEFVIRSEALALEVTVFGPDDVLLVECYQPGVPSLLCGCAPATAPPVPAERGTRLVGAHNQCTFSAPPCPGPCNRLNLGRFSFTDDDEDLIVTPDASSGRASVAASPCDEAAYGLQASL